MTNLPNISPAGNDINTTEGQVKEFLYCKNNPIYFVENYIRIQEAGADQLLKLYSPQKKFLNDIYIHHHCIALKSRQTGISTVSQAYIAHSMTFYKNIVVGVISREGSESSDFCRKVANMLDGLPMFLRPVFIKRVEQTFILENGSQFYASQVNASSPGNLFRGKAVSIAIIDEAAFVRHIDAAYTGFSMALSKAQSVCERNGLPYATLIISTPNLTTGIGKWYYQQWKAAQDDAAIFHPVQIHWSDVEEFRNDPGWYKKQCNILGNVDWKIRQELEMEFIASENSFFEAKTIGALNNISVGSPNKIKMKVGNLLIFNPPIPDRFYIIGIDTATSHGADRSAIQVLDYVTFEQVAEYNDKLRVDDFCEVVDRVNTIYRNNLLVVEANSVGNQVVESLTKTSNVYNLYRQKIKNSATNTESRFKYGIQTTSQTRPLMMDALYTMITEDPTIIKSKRTVYELIGLIKKTNGKVEADDGERDDLCLAFAFCAYVKMYDPPLGFANTAMGVNEVDDIIGIASMNDSVSFYDRDRMSNEDSDGSVLTLNGVQHMNNKIKNHLKENLHDLIRDHGGTIDILDILGNNSSPREKIRRQEKLF